MPTVAVVHIYHPVQLAVLGQVHPLFLWPEQMHLTPCLLGFTPVVGGSPASFWCWEMNLGVLRWFETVTNGPLVREEYSPPIPPPSPSLSSNEAPSAKGRSSSSSHSSVAPDLLVITSSISN